MEKEEKKKTVKKNNKFFIFIIIIILVIIIINNIKGQENYKEKDYDIKSSLYSVVKVKDPYFEKQKDKKYNLYDLILVSFSLENLSTQNYDLNYELKTEFGNTYKNVNGSHITTEDSYMVENFLKVIGHNSIDETKILGSENKKCILAYMIPQHEFKEDNTFKICNSYDSAKMESIDFVNSNIKESNNLKELFTQEELDKIEQKISLYYTAYHVSNTLNMQSMAWNSNDNKLLDLYLLTTIEMLKGNKEINWNNQVDENGYKIDFNKCKEYFPSISNDIETLQNSVSIQEKADNQLRKYNSLQKINYNEFVNNSYDLQLACFNIKRHLCE